MEHNEQIKNILEEMLVWTKAGMYSSVSSLIMSEFENTRDEKKLAYELLDGDRSQSEIVGICKNEFGSDAQVSTSSLSNWVNSWEKLGLIKKYGISVTKNFSLLDFNFNNSFLKKY